MRKQARSVVLMSAALAAATVVVVAASRPLSSTLTVHEWGTFTSVAGPNGQSVDWTPLSGPQDLPCFVRSQDPLTNVQVKGRDIFGMLKALTAPGQAVGAVATVAKPMPLPVPAPPPAVMVAKVRMETPVLYFYSPEATSVRVKVAFQQGVMSEWYPPASVPRVNVLHPLTTTTGTIEWPVVNVLPHAKPEYPQDARKSHYYAARDVDASPVQAGGLLEKFLFYRGLADFQPSISATVGAGGDVTATVPPGTARLVLFENRQGRVGYSIAREAASRVTISRPAAASLEALRADLVAMLTAEGLYPREAAAMVETWRDSWFEEGTRLFYIVPKGEIEARLPLTISPAPAAVARVFVGRLELITPEMKDAVERAIVNNDLDALSTHGRFLDSIVAQIQERPSISANPVRVGTALKAIATSRPGPAACR